LDNRRLGLEDGKKTIEGAFDEVDYILNLSMLENGVLENIILEGL